MRRRGASSTNPRARLAIDVGPGEVPTEFRIFAFGVNHSEKGDFLFDQQSAQSVMDQYREHGKPMLLDFNHGTTLFDPTPDQGVAAGEFAPEIRADGLWATQIKWTDRARGYLSAKEYRCFSPFFEHDPKTGRVLRLINVALTNLPALDHIEPLVAASANQGGSSMDWEKLYNELRPRYEALETEVKALRSKLSAYEDKEPDKVQALSLRATIHKLTGKTDDAEAIGALQALSAARDRLATLEKQLETERTTRLSAEFGAALDKAIQEERKVPPAQKEYWEGIARDDGFEKALARLRGFTATAVALTAARATDQPTASKGGGMSEAQKQMAATLGWSPERVAAYEKFMSASGGGS